MGGKKGRSKNLEGVVYPVSTTLRRNMEDTAKKLGMEAMPAAVKMIVDTVGEYEHGSADLEHVNSGMTLQMYADVAADLALVILYQS